MKNTAAPGAAEEGPADAGSNSTLYRAQASPFSQMTNDSGAGGVVLGPGSSFNTMNAPETQEPWRTAPATATLSGGASSSATGRNSAPASKGS